MRYVQLDDVSKARPEITSAVEAMISKGKWTVPGYTESESFILSFVIVADPLSLLFRRVRSKFRFRCSHSELY